MKSTNSVVPYRVLGGGEGEYQYQTFILFGLQTPIYFPLQIAWEYQGIRMIFQQSLENIRRLCNIPYGNITTYKRYTPITTQLIVFVYRNNYRKEVIQSFSYNILKITCFTITALLTWLLEGLFTEKFNKSRKNENLEIKTYLYKFQNNL